MTVNDSILNTTKRTLGLAEDYNVFDIDVAMHINSALGTLNQLGIGPEEGFSVVDGAETWQDFLGQDPRLNPAKSYVYLRVRLLFDPPAIGYVLTAWEKQLDELVWRLNVLREDVAHPVYVPPGSETPMPPEEDNNWIYDGGGV